MTEKEKEFYECEICNTKKPHSELTGCIVCISIVCSNCCIYNNKRDGCICINCNDKQKE